MIAGHDRVRIAVKALCCERTVARVYQGRGTPYSRLRVAAAAKSLGIEPPPEQPVKIEASKPEMGS